MVPDRLSVAPERDDVFGTKARQVLGQGRLGEAHSRLQVAHASFAAGQGAQHQKPGAQALADKVSRTWATFARTGNPNHSGIPKWNAFNPTDFTTMVFDRETKAVNDPYGDIRKEIARLRAEAGPR